MKRISKIERKTQETDIVVVLDVDGGGEFNGSTGIGFFDHMLSSFTRHGNFGLTINCKGDLEVDAHHTVEDVGIVLGKAFAQAAGDLRGITRFADSAIPMDDALVMAAADISGRSYLNFDIDMAASTTGDFDNGLVKEFFLAFVRSFPITLHIKLMYGENSHHIIESAFKAAAITLRKALTVSGKGIPSTKGTLI